jgi:transposase
MSHVRRIIRGKLFTRAPLARRALRRRGIAHSIPEKRDQRAHRRSRGSAGGRPPKFDHDRYKQRNVVERCFARLKQFRALATRYAKRAVYYRALLIIAATGLVASRGSPGQALGPARPDRCRHPSGTLTGHRHGHPLHRRWPTG